MRLPSGHLLVYPFPEVVIVEIETDAVEEDDITGELILVHKVFTTEQMSFFGPLPLSAMWGRITTPSSAPASIASSSRRRGA